VTVATKGGLERPNGAWTRNGRPGHLRRACEASLAALGVDRIDVYQLHAPDPSVPFADSVGELARLRAEGKIAHVGLSNVTVSEIEEARRIVPVVSVQNRWNPGDRAPETDGVLATCSANAIAFLPYSPFGGASGARRLSAGKLAAEAKLREMSPHRLVLAWMLAKSPAVITIPGARRIESIADSAGAADVTPSARSHRLEDERRARRLGEVEIEAKVPRGRHGFAHVGSGVRAAVGAGVEALTREERVFDELRVGVEAELLVIDQRAPHEDAGPRRRLHRRWELKRERRVAHAFLLPVFEAIPVFQ